MKAIIFDEIGLPEKVLYLAEVPVPQIADDEVLVRMVASSVNPGDFLFIQNLYPEPKKPVFPSQIAGNHGAGIIEKTGKNVKLKTGRLVAFSHYNTWSEYIAVPASYLIELPKDFPIEKAAQMVNLISAWDLLTDSGVKRGQWLAVTAGNSAVSLMVSQFAKYLGINVIAIVRKKQEGLTAEITGAARIIDLSELKVSLKEKIMKITDGAGINAIIDNVGGPLLADVIKAVAFNSKVVINGGMSSEKFELHNFDILMTKLEIKAHIYRYFFTPPQKEDLAMLNELITIAAQPEFYIHTGGHHKLEDFKIAVQSTLQHPEKGKHFLVS